MVLGQPLSQNNSSPFPTFLPPLSSPSPLHLLDHQDFATLHLCTLVESIFLTITAVLLCLSRPEARTLLQKLPTRLPLSLSRILGARAFLETPPLYSQASSSVSLACFLGTHNLLAISPLYSPESSSAYLPCALGSHGLPDNTFSLLAGILFRLSRLTSGGSSIPGNISSLLAIIILRLSCDFLALPPLYSPVQSPLSLSPQTSFADTHGW